MSTLTPPPPMAPPPGQSSAMVTNMVKPPGIALIVVGILGIALQLLSTVANLLGFGFSATDLSQLGDLGDTSWMAFLFSGAYAVIVGVVGLIMNGVIAFGGYTMMKLGSYALAMTGTIVAMVPCNPACCCLLQVPFGIWALVILLKPEVKAAFQG
jgi:hypothetical protein